MSKPKNLLAILVTVSPWAYLLSFQTSGAFPAICFSASLEMAIAALNLPKFCGCFTASFLTNIMILINIYV